MKAGNCNAGSFDQALNLHWKDMFTINLTDLLDYTIPLNKLKPIFNDKNIAVRGSEPQKLAAAKTTIDLKTLEIERIVSTSTQEDLLVIFYVNKSKENRYLLLTHSGTGSNLGFDVKQGEFMGNLQICKGFHLSSDLRIFGMCISEGSQRISFCSKKITEEPRAVCFDFGGEYEVSTLDFENGEPDVQSYVEDDISLLIAYIKGATSPKLKDKFWLISANSQKFLRVPKDDFSISQIRFSRYAKDTNSIMILISSSNLEGDFVYSLKINDFNVDPNSLEPVKPKTKMFLHYERELIIIDSNEKSKMTVYISMLDAATKTIKVDNFGKLINAKICSNFGVIAFEDGQSKLNYFVYDFSSEVYYLFHDDKQASSEIFELIESNKKSILTVIDKSALTLRTTLIAPFQNFYVQALNKDVKEEKVVLSIDDSKIASFTLNFKNFEDFSIQNSKPIMVSDIEGENYFNPEIRGNNPSSNEPERFFHFGEVNLKEINQPLNECSPKSVVSEKLQVFFLCADGSILSLEEFQVDAAEIKNARVAKYSSKNEQMNFNKVMKSRVIFGTYLVLLYEENMIAVISLVQMRRDKIYTPVFIEQFKLNFQCCNFEGQGLTCMNGDQKTFFYFEVDMKSNMIQFVSHSEIIENVVGQNVFYSFYDRGFFVGLIKEDLVDGYQFVGYDGLLTKMYIDNFPKVDLSKAIVVQITQEAYLFIQSKVHPLEMFAVVERSIITFPIENYIKNFSEIARIASLNKDNMFAIAYKTNDNKVRGAVFRASLDVNRRLVSDFSMDEEKCDEFTFEMGSYSDNEVVIYYSCPTSTPWSLRIWYAEPNGPFLRHKIFETTDTFTINDNKYTFILEHSKYSGDKNSFSADNINVEFKDASSPAVEIEKEFLNIKGDLMRVVVEHFDDAKVLGRIVQKSKIDLLSDSIIKPNQSDVRLQYIADDPVISFKNFLLVKGAKNKMQYDSCAVIKTVYSYADPKPFLLCRSDRDFTYVFTDNEKITLSIDQFTIEPNLELGDIFMAETKDYFLLFFQYKGTKVFKLITLISVADGGLRVTKDKSFSIEDFYTDGKSIMNYLMVFNDDEKKTFDMIFVPYATNFVLIKSVTAIDNNFASGFQKISFAEHEENNFYAASFFAKEAGILRMFLMGKALIYNVLLKKGEGEWKSEIVSKLTIPRGNYITGARMINTDEHLIVLQNTNPSDINLVVFKTDEKVPYILQAFGKNEINLKNYHIENFSMKKLSKGEVQICLLILTDLSESGTFKSLSFLDLNVSGLSISLSKKIHASQQVTLTAFFMDQTSKSSNLLLTVGFKPFSNLKYFLILLLLLAILAVTGYFALKMFRENKQRVREGESTTPLN